MKRIVILLSVVALLSGCAKKYCYIRPGLSQIKQATVGSEMIAKWECIGRITVDRCTEPLELIYLGRTHPGNFIRIASRVGSRSPFITEATYSEDSKVIYFQDAKIEVVEASDNSLIFKLMNISTSGCDKVNGQKVKRER